MRIALLLSCLLLPPASPAAREVGEHKLPASVRVRLDRRFPGWRFAEVREEIRRALKESSPGAHPVLVRGDFDDDGRVDYALLIEQGSFNNDEGVGRRSHLVVLLRRRNGYALHHVASPAGEYLLLWKKGDRAYNYATQKRFILRKDAVEAVIFEKAGTTYVYERGRFRPIITGD